MHSQNAESRNEGSALCVQDFIAYGFMCPEIIIMGSNDAHVDNDSAALAESNSIVIFSHIQANGTRGPDSLLEGPSL